MCKAKTEIAKRSNMTYGEAIDYYCGKLVVGNEDFDEVYEKHEAMYEPIATFRNAMWKDEFDDMSFMIHEKIWNHKGWAKGIAQEIHTELQNEVEKELFWQMWDENEIMHSKRNSGHAERRKRTATAKKRKQKALANASVYCTSEVKANGAVKSIKVNAKKPNAYKRNNRVSYVPEIETEFISAGDKLYSHLTEIETEMNRVRNLLKNLEADYNGTLEELYNVK